MAHTRNIALFAMAITLPLTNGRQIELAHRAVDRYFRADVARRQHDGRETGRAQVSALIDAFHFDIDQGTAVLHVFLDDRARHEGGISLTVEQARFHAQALEPAVVSHPVDDGRRKPAGALRQVIVHAGHTDILREIFTVVADTGVLDAAAGGLVPDVVFGMLRGVPQQRAVRRAPAGGDDEGHGIGHRERSAGNLVDLIAHAYIVPMASLGTAYAFGFGQHHHIDPRALLGRVDVRLDVLVLARLARCLALVTGRQPERAANDFIALVRVS